MICGRRSTYVEGCRCAACRRANADYMHEYKHRSRQTVRQAFAAAPVEPEPERELEPYWGWRR
jgi:hypothetical protein